MTNTELVTYMANLFGDYIRYFLPLYGLFAGVNIVIKWTYSFTFRPFNSLGR